MKTCIICGSPATIIEIIDGICTECSDMASVFGFDAINPSPEK